MVVNDPDYDPTHADDVGGPGDTLGPAEATDPDEVRNVDGDVVVDPPDHWYEADKLSAKAPGEGESLDEKLAAEEPDLGARDSAEPAGAEDYRPPDIDRDTRHHQGQVDDAPEDGDSLFPVVE